MKILKRILLGLVILGALAIITIFFINYYVLKFSREDYFKEVSDLPEVEVGLVFGASILNNSKPSDILKDRLDVAYKAYEAGKIKQILVSGDNSKTYYNEPLVMKKYLIDLGVKESDIYEDFAGFDTYDSLYRAREIFGVNKVILFTQDFHLKRAMYIAKRLGFETYGIETNLHRYFKEKYNFYREILARVKAFLEVEIFKTGPKFLGETIKIVSDEEIEEVKKILIDWENGSGSGEIE